MFDGNFRSSRREVNLSGSNRRVGGNNKHDLLKNAEVQRRQRREKNRRLKASKVLQRVLRGHLSRMHTIENCVANISLADSKTDHDMAFTPRAIQKQISALSLCFSYHSLMTKFGASRRELLLKFHRNTFHPGSIEYSYHIKSSNRLQHTDIEVEGETHYVDSQPMEVDQQCVDGEYSSWFSKNRIIENILEEFSPQCNDACYANKKLYELLEAYKETTQIDDRIFIKLTSCMQKWCIFVEDKINALRNMENGDDGGYSVTLSPEKQNGYDPIKYMVMLRGWAINMSVQLKNPNSKALLATILLSGRVAPSSSFHAITGTKDEWETTFPKQKFEEWYFSLADTIRRSSTINTTDEYGDLLLQATMENLRSHEVQRLLSNILDLSKSSQLILLINHILRQPQNSNLKLAVSLLARGDTITRKQQHPEDENFSSTNSMDKLDNWDEEHSENDEENFDYRPSSHKKARGESILYKRQDLLTIVKLDKHYNERVQEALHHRKNVFDTLTVDVATKIVKAPWKEWGLFTLCDREYEETDGIDDNNNNFDTVQADCYLETLSYLLQASSGIRPTTRFTPLSHLAFSPAILHTLWILILKGKRGYILSIFSDLFSHYLLALNDEDFVKYHCKNESSFDIKNKINAKDLVSIYGQELHELYWTKPVVCSEIQMDNVRGRLILSGTKLWNSLYERWNRLINITFCPESDWWFPNVGSKEGDKVVISHGEIGNEAYGDNDDDGDSMDIDEDRNHLSKSEEASDALADSFQDPKMARLLTSIPQALPFDRRVKLFHSLLKADKQKVFQADSSRRVLMAMRGQSEIEGELMMWLDGSVREQIKIKRSSLYKDSMETLSSLGTRLKHKIQVTFINKHGAEEPGIDGGGVFKEFLDDLITDGFASRDDGTEGGAPRLFSITSKQQQLAMNLDLIEDKNMLVHYEFLGRVLGKAVYESILVEPQFCLPFLNQLLGKVNTLEDLKNYDEEYYNNLNKLRYYTEEEIDSLGLTFELTVSGTSPNRPPRTVNLIQYGRTIVVTKNNVFQYTHAVANHLLNILGIYQTRAFLRGFRDLIKVAWVRLFSAKELQKLISGDDSIRGIDVSSLKKSTNYLGGYHGSQPYIQDFWDIIENEFSPEQQRKFLRFMTSCSRQPLLGFSSLEPFPAIQQIRLQNDERSKNSRLPTSSTCMNLLKLPNYQDRNLLKEKLLAAVESGAGFELT